MRVAFISRASLYRDQGGDTIQIIHTAAQLRNLGIEVAIFLADEKPDYLIYDLIHFFNIIRPDDILPHISRTHKPFVVSTIFVDYSEYEKKARRGASAFFFRFLSPDVIEYLKSLARSLISKEKIKSPYYLFNGHKRSIRKIVKKASMLLPNSQSEYDRFLFSYGIPKEYRVIPNGIDKHLFIPRNNEVLRDDRLILCVARIEGRKNQLNLIRAMANTSYRLVLIGDRSTHQKHYYERCKRAATPNIQFIDFMEQESLLDYYRMAKVHVLPSWFETTGLSSLEAAAMGCNIVITSKGDSYEYLQDYAYYCDPESPDSIFRAVEQAASNAIQPGLASFVREQYNWETAAKKTLEAYTEVVQIQLNEDMHPGHPKT
jgi:glycosyltransferase involved in cell wall biosynthesis